MESFQNLTVGQSNRDKFDYYLTSWHAHVDGFEDVGDVNVLSLSFMYIYRSNRMGRANGEMVKGLDCKA